MTKKYELWDQVLAVTHEAATWEEMQTIVAAAKETWVQHCVTMFQPSVLTQNEDGSWTQAAADENGEPIVAPDYTQEPISLG